MSALDPTARAHATTVSVILPTYNVERWIQNQLTALTKQDYAGEWELIVADNGSTDGTREIALSFQKSFPRFSLIDAPEIRRPSYVRNKAVLAASGDWLLFADADDIVCPGWIAQLTDGLRNSSIAAGTVKHFADGRTANPVEARRPNEYPHAGLFYPLAGCNMGITRKLFLELGGFDETLPFGWSDFELGVRAQLRGISVTWAERAFVWRRRPASAGEMWGKELVYGRGWTILERRYPQLSPRGWLRPLLRRAGWVAVHAPYIVMKDRRRGWVMKAAGLAGRLAERLFPST